MSIPYQNIAKGVAIRAHQIVGGNAADREAAYAAASIEAAMTGTAVPYSALKQDILAQEKEIAALVANSSNSLFKIAMEAESDALGSGDVLPEFDDAGVSFIGNFDGIFDADDDTPLTEKPKQEVLRRIENKGNFFKLPYYGYFIEGSKIYFKSAATEVVVRGCSWDMATADSMFDALSESFLPQELEVLWICKVLEALPREGWFISEAGVYSNLVSAKQSDIIEGKARIMEMPMIPTKTASAEPMKD